MSESDQNIFIVYNVYINPEADWQRLVKFQLNDLKRSGILEVAELHIVASNPFNISNIEHQFNFKNISINSLEIYPSNDFEFPGIKKTYELAFKRENGIVAYLHTKGITHRKKLFRNHQEILLTNLTFQNWKEIANHFQTDPSLDLAGVMPAKEGDFVWFNFWWSSASYLRTRAIPAICNDRFYYEKWLSHNLIEAQSRAKMLNILKNSNETYTAKEAVEYLKKVARVRRNQLLVLGRRIEFYFSK